MICTRMNTTRHAYLMTQEKAYSGDLDVWEYLYLLLCWVMMSCHKVTLITLTYLYSIESYNLTMRCHNLQS